MAKAYTFGGDLVLYMEEEVAVSYNRVMGAILMAVPVKLCTIAEDIENYRRVVAAVDVLMDLSGGCLSIEAMPNSVLVPYKDS